MRAGRVFAKRCSNGCARLFTQWIRYVRDFTPCLQCKNPYKNLLALTALSALFIPWPLLHTSMYPMASVYVMSSAASEKML